MRADMKQKSKFGAIIVLAGVLGLMVGCGNKGELYLPEDAPAQESQDSEASE